MGSGNRQNSSTLQVIYADVQVFMLYQTTNDINNYPKSTTPQYVDALYFGGSFVDTHFHKNAFSIAPFPCTQSKDGHRIISIDHTVVAIAIAIYRSEFILTLFSHLDKQRYGSERQTSAGPVNSQGRKYR